MVILGLGANLESRHGTTGPQSLDLACQRLEIDGLALMQRSPWYESAAVPVSDQPWFANGVVRIATDLEPAALLVKIKEIETWFGRHDETRWAARPMDIDILDYKGQILPDAASWRAHGEAERAALILPHPRLHERRFVLAPLARMAPHWLHPVLGKSATELLEGLDDDPDGVRILDPAAD